jgi:hypothetical protein
VTGNVHNTAADTQSRSIDPEEDVRIGERLRIQDGPLLGLEGFLVEQRSARVVLSVRLLKSIVMVEMHRSCVRLVAHPEG